MSQISRGAVHKEVGNESGTRRQPRTSPAKRVDPAHEEVSRLHERAGNNAVCTLLRDGAQLDPKVRADMEARFGESFEDVRVHNDDNAHRGAAELDAKAYTVGNNIAFSAERYAPHRAEGKRLLAHELAHVVQQRRGGATPSLESDAAHERSAERAANAIANAAPTVSVQGSTGVGVAREPEKYEKKRTTPLRKGTSRTPDDEFNDFKKMLSNEFGAKGDLTSGKLIELYRHGSRATVTKYVKQSLMKRAQALRGEANKGPKVLELGDFKLELKLGQSIEKQVDAFVKKLEGAHSMPQAFGKKLPGDAVRDLPGGKYNPEDALVQFTDKPVHTAMDQPWKDAFNSLRKSGGTETTAGKVFDMVADGIRKTPGMSDGEKASRIARLHDEMFAEMKLDPNRRYSVPRIYTWLEILGFKSKGKKKAPGKEAAKEPKIEPEVKPKAESGATTAATKMPKASNTAKTTGAASVKPVEGATTPAKPAVEPALAAKPPAQKVTTPSPKKAAPKADVKGNWGQSQIPAKAEPIEGSFLISGPIEIEPRAPKGTPEKSIGKKSSSQTPVKKAAPQQWNPIAEVVPPNEGHAASKQVLGGRGGETVRIRSGGGTGSHPESLADFPRSTAQQAKGTGLAPQPTPAPHVAEPASTPATPTKAVVPPKPAVPTAGRPLSTSQGAHAEAKTAETGLGSKGQQKMVPVLGETPKVAVETMGNETPPPQAKVTPAKKIAPSVKVAPKPATPLAGSAPAIADEARRVPAQPKATEPPPAKAAPATPKAAATLDGVKPEMALERPRQIEKAISAFQSVPTGRGFNAAALIAGLLVEHADKKAQAKILGETLQKLAPREKEFAARPNDGVLVVQTIEFSIRDIMNDKGYQLVGAEVSFGGKSIEDAMSAHDRNSFVVGPGRPDRVRERHHTFFILENGSYSVSKKIVRVNPMKDD